MVGVAELADRLGLRRVGMDRRRERAEPHAVRHRQHELADRLAGVARDQRRAEDPALAVDVDPREALGLAVEDRAIDRPRAAR